MTLYLGSCSYVNNFLQIIRHVGRERVPKDSDFLTGNSPRGTVTLSRPDPTRQSVAPDMDDTNTMEMSIRQVVEQKKMTSSVKPKN